MQLRRSHRVFTVLAATSVVVASAGLTGCSSGDTGSGGYKGGGASSVPSPWGKGGAPASNANSSGSSGDTSSGSNGNTGSNGNSGSNNDQPPGMDSGAPAADDAGSKATPDTGAAVAEDSGMASTSGFDQFQVHNLDVVNMYRATLNVAPLVLDQTLSTFALAGSTELSMDHTPHQHFISASNDNSIWMDGFNNSAAENQGDPNGWTVLSQDPTMNELSQIDQIQQAMFAEGPGTGEAHGHYTNMMNAEYTRLGVGLLEVNGALYLTNDFSN